MKRIGVYEAKTNLADILKRVNEGESFEITRHGIPVALLIPHIDANRRPPSDTIEAIKELRRSFLSKPFSAGEIKEMIEEGRM